MNRHLAAVACSFAIAAAGPVYAPTASAEPSTTTAEPSCEYTLSTPQVVQVSGALMVVATLRPFPCTGSINPNYLSVCLRTQEGSTAGNCGFNSVPSIAEVFLPYQTGATYVATGTGCGSVFAPPGSVCSTLGPVTSTL